MADVVVTAATPAVTPTPPPATPIDVTVAPEIIDNRVSLFEDAPAKFTEAELMGEDAPATPPGETPATPAPSEAAAGKEATPTTPAEKAAEAAKTIPEKPPEGFVPIQALHEARGKTKTVEEQLQIAQTMINDLTEKLSSGPVVPQAGAEAQGEVARFQAKYPDFKVLTDEEYDDLAGEDVAAAQRYLKRANDYEKAVTKDESQKERAKSISEMFAKTAAITVTAAKQQMAALVPGLYDNNDVADKLEAFAVDNGLDKDYLLVLTDPATQIMPPGSKRPYLMGRGAVGLVKLIHNLSTKAASGNGDLEKQITERITKELIEKFKSPTGFQNIGEAPASATVVDDNKEYTPEEIERLDETTRIKYLGG